MISNPLIPFQQHQGLLTPVCEALSALLFPFAWEHVYIPFLPVKLIEYLHVRTCLSFAITAHHT